jgi:hypothetical protein
MTGYEEGYSSIDWLVGWGLADDFGKIGIVCHNQTHTT